MFYTSKNITLVLWASLKTKLFMELVHLVFECWVMFLQHSFLCATANRSKTYSKTPNLWTALNSLQQLYILNNLNMMLNCWKKSIVFSNYLTTAPIIWLIVHVFTMFLSCFNLKMYTTLMHFIAWSLLNCSSLALHFHFIFHLKIVESHSRPHSFPF